MLLTRACIIPNTPAELAKISHSRRKSILVTKKNPIPTKPLYTIADNGEAIHFSTKVHLPTIVKDMQELGIEVDAYAIFPGVLAFEHESDANEFHEMLCDDDSYVSDDLEIFKVKSEDLYDACEESKAVVVFIRQMLLVTSLLALKKYLSDGNEIE